MQEILRETRKEAFKKIKPKTQLILNELGDSVLTARELATKLYKKEEARTAERQEVAPRLSELVKLDLVEVVGKKYDETTKANVATYRRKRGK